MLWTGPTYRPLSCVRWAAIGRLWAPDRTLRWTCCCCERRKTRAACRGEEISLPTQSQTATLRHQHLSNNITWPLIFLCECTNRYWFRISEFIRSNSMQIDHRSFYYSSYLFAVCKPGHSVADSFCTQTPKRKMGVNQRLIDCMIDWWSYVHIGAYQLSLSFWHLLKRLLCIPQCCSVSFTIMLTACIIMYLLIQGD